MANLYDMYYSLAMNKQLYREGRIEANTWADRVEECYKRDSLLCDNYNHHIANGKWNHICLKYAFLRTLKEYWNMKQVFGNIYQSLVSLFAVNLQPKQKQMYKNESDV